MNKKKIEKTGIYFAILIILVLLYRFVDACFGDYIRELLKEFIRAK